MRIGQWKPGTRKRKRGIKTCQEKIRKHKLDMKLIDAEYTFDNNKVLFYLQQTEGLISENL